MSIESYLAFVLATAVLILTPGPVVALIVGNSLAYGARNGLAAVAGASLATSVHMTLVVFGMASFLSVIGSAFFWIKWLGAAYLLVLAIQAFATPAENLDAVRSKRKPLKIVFVESFLVGATNPKPLLFYAAFFPLFVSTNAPLAPQLAVLAVTFLIVAAALDSCWALGAARLAPALGRMSRYRNKVVGSVYLAAAAALAIARKS